MSTDTDEEAKDEGPEHNTAPPAEVPVGYKHPPVAHQFKKGVCPNPRGRPRKVERSYTPRQLRRDILGVGNSPTTIKTNKGIKKVTVIEAVRLRTISKALSGHGPSSRYILKEYDAALREHNEVHDKDFKELEEFEMHLTSHPEAAKSEWLTGYLAWKRKLTRRT
jgi:hypothetical protein